MVDTGTTDPDSCRSRSQRGDVDVDGTGIELLMTGTSAGPRREIEPARILNVSMGASDVEQRIARVETDEEIVEPAPCRQAVDLPQQIAEHSRIVIGDTQHRRVGAAESGARSR